MRILRVGGRRVEKSSKPLWMWPTVTGILAFGAALLTVPLSSPGPLRLFEWPGSADSATTLLQVIAGSVITVTGPTLTLTVVALQLASQQFSPRLLRDFSRDRVLKVVLSILIATLVYSATLLHRIHSDEPLPALGLVIASLLGLASVAGVLAFITHMTTVLRVDNMMRMVHDETDHVIAAFYPTYGDHRPRSPDELSQPDEDPKYVRASRSGFVRVIDVAALVRAASAKNFVVWVMVRPGDHVVRGTPMAVGWTPGSECDEPEMADAVNAVIELGFERSIEQDAAFGFRQLTDIAVKAISPGINDPVTAVHCAGHMADLLVKLAGRRLGATLHDDAEGIGRAVVPDRDLEYYLELVCGPIRRFGRSEPTVLVGLLRMLRDVGCACRDDDQRAQVAAQAELIVAELPEFESHDARTVTTMAERVQDALRGRTFEAYTDRSGETRSI